MEKPTRKQGFKHNQLKDVEPSLKIPGTKPYKSNEWGTNTMQNKLGIACDTTRMEATTSHPLDAIYESKERNQEHSVVNENVGHE